MLKTMVCGKTIICVPELALFGPSGASVAEVLDGLNLNLTKANKGFKASVPSEVCSRCALHGMPGQAVKGNSARCPLDTILDT